MILRTTDDQGRSLRTLVAAEHDEAHETGRMQRAADLHVLLLLIDAALGETPAHG